MTCPTSSFFTSAGVPGWSGEISGAALPSSGDSAARTRRTAAGSRKAPVEAFERVTG